VNECRSVSEKPLSRTTRDCGMHDVCDKSGEEDIENVQEEITFCIPEAS